MNINKNKVHSLIKRSVWDYSADTNGKVNHEEVRDAINNFQVPYKHVDEFIDQHRERIIKEFESSDHDDINRFAACMIADDIAQIMTKCEHEVTFKIYLPCTSHF
jgi:hypothetical protein